MWWQLLSHPYSEKEKVGRIVHHPLHNIDFGAKSQPVVMIHDEIDDDLHSQWLKEHLHSCTEAELKDMSGLENDYFTDYGMNYHTMPTNKAVYSKHINPTISKEFSKPAAPPFTRAFYIAFREVNKEIFDTLKYNLWEASSYHTNNNTITTIGSEQHEDVCSIFASWIDKGFHFGDIALQIQYGQGSKVWHVDGENSLLHLAVTLRGSRTIHSKLIQSSSSNSTNLLRRRSQSSSQNNMREERRPIEITEQQNPRDVYLTSPTLFSHASHFPDVDYDHRVIAIHARILYTSEELHKFQNARKKKDGGWDTFTNVLADTLSVAKIRMPSLKQVEKRLLLLEPTTKIT